MRPKLWGNDPPPQYIKDSRTAAAKC